MMRTKALGLLHKQLNKDSAMSRQGIPDYLITMRKPGINEQPITGHLTYYAGEDPGDLPVDGDESVDARTSIDIWQRYASPVWMDINPSKTLQKESGREDRDEKHVCPLQLQVIERALQLWTNQNDLVYSPFTGIGSEGYVSLKMGRRFVGAELKASYYVQAIANLKVAQSLDKQQTLF
jgi:DNA modification methylase